MVSGISRDTSWQVRGLTYITCPISYPEGPKLYDWGVMTACSSFGCSLDSTLTLVVPYL
jgi:hypothetical protein